jgi:chromosome segregation ATPase
MENNNIIITFLRNILKVYHESFLAYSNENKTLRDKVDKLQSSSYQLDTKLNDYSKQIKEKETEITSLKSQITKLTLSLSTKDKDKETITNIIKPTTTTPNPNNNSTSLKTSSQIMPTDPRQVTFSATDDDLINSSIIPINKHQEMIKDLNTKNINDLDALYFNDKVEMAESNRDVSPQGKGGGQVVPKLNFGVMGCDTSSSGVLGNVHFNVPKIINNVYLKKN